MDTTADKTLSVASVPEAQRMEQDRKDWAQYSQWIAAAMSKRMSELGLTQKMLAGKMGRTQQYFILLRPLRYRFASTSPILGEELMNIDGQHLAFCSLTLPLLLWFSQGIHVKIGE